MGAFNKMGGHAGKSPGRPRTVKREGCDNEDFWEEWNWLFRPQGTGVSADSLQKTLMDNVHAGEKKSSQYRINFCEKCHKCWEKVRKTINLSGCLYYEDFPTIGKRRINCPPCAKKRA